MVIAFRPGSWPALLQNQTWQMQNEEFTTEQYKDDNIVQSLFMQ